MLPKGVGELYACMSADSYNWQDFDNGLFGLPTLQELRRRYLPGIELRIWKDLFISSFTFPVIDIVAENSPRLGYACITAIVYCKWSAPKPNYSVKKLSCVSFGNFRSSGQQYFQQQELPGRGRTIAWSGILQTNFRSLQRTHTMIPNITKTSPRMPVTAIGDSHIFIFATVSNLNTVNKTVRKFLLATFRYSSASVMHVEYRGNTNRWNFMR